MMILDLSPELNAKVNEWACEFNMAGEELVVGLLEEYFEDCDEADRISALIHSGQMQTYPAEKVHEELRYLDAVEA